MAVSRLTQTSLQNAFQKFNSAWDGRSAVGSMDAIGVVVLNAGASSIAFSNIPSTYTHLQIRGIAAGSSNSFADMIFNSDTGSNYSFHDIYGDGTSAGAENGTSRANIPTTALPNVTSVFNSFVIDILDYSNTNKYKTARILQGRDANGSGVLYFMSGLWFKAGSGVTSDAINSITITARSGNIATYSSFALYGIK